MRFLVAVLIITSPAFAGTWILSGKGSHAAAGGGSTVTIDTSAKGGGFGPSTNPTVAITVASNSNRVLYLFAGVGVSAGSDEIVSVSSSLDGALTQVGSAASDGAWTNAQVWRLINPTAGSHTITVTTSGGQTLSEAMAISLYNVDQTTPNDSTTVVNGSSSSSAPTGSVTLSSGEMAVGFINTDSGTGVSVTTGTQRQESENVNSDNAFSLATNTGTGTVSTTWATNNDSYSLIVVPVNAAP